MPDTNCRLHSTLAVDKSNLHAVLQPGRIEQDLTVKRATPACEVVVEHPNKFSRSHVTGYDHKTISWHHVTLCVTLDVIPHRLLDGFLRTTRLLAVGMSAWIYEFR